MPSLFRQVLDRHADVHGLVERKPQLDTGRDADHLRQGTLKRIHHLDGVRDRLFVDAQIDRAVAVGADNVGLNVRGIVHGAQVSDPDRVALSIDLDDDVVDRLHSLELIVRKHVIVKVARFDVARGQDQVGRLHCSNHIQD